MMVRQLHAPAILPRVVQLFSTIFCVIFVIFAAVYGITEKFITMNVNYL